MMITWHEQPGQLLCSSTFGDGYSTYYFRFAFTGADLGNSHTLDLDQFAQGGTGFAPFNWKGVYHLKVDGHLSPYSDIVYYDATSGENPPQVPISTDLSSSGIKTNSGFLVFPGEGAFSAVHYGSTKEAHVLYGRAANGKFSCCVVRISYYNGKKPYYYASGGSGEVPSSVWGKKYDDLGSAVSGIAGYMSGAVFSSWRLIGAYRYTLDNRRVPTLSETEVRHLVCHWSSRIRGFTEAGFRDVKPQLHATAFDAIMKFDGNMLAFLPEIGGFGRTTFESISKFVESGHGVKDAASLWLSQRYGDRLTKSDMSELFGQIDRQFLTIHKPKTCRYVVTKSRQSFSISCGDAKGAVDAVVNANCQIASAPKDYNALMKLVRVAYEWDFYPSLGNVWDMIPLSFVVDWFVNVGDIYESVDRMVQSRYYDVPAVMMSYKTTASVPQIGGVKFTLYRRWIEQRLDLGVSSVELGLPSAINVVDGISLLVS